MTSIASARPVTAASVPGPVVGRTRRRPGDVLFAAAVVLLLAVHLTIFLATALQAPVTAAEQRATALAQLPVEVCRALVLPFHAVLLGSLFVLGRRAAGRWAGFGSMLAVLAVDLRADAADPVFGPATAPGGWIAAALLALAFVQIGRRPLAAAVLAGVASGFFALAALALPAILVATGVHARGRRMRGLLTVAGAWIVPALLVQIVWIARLGPAGWSDRALLLVAQPSPHPLVPFLEQQRIVFGAWHFDPLLTAALATFLFAAAGIGIARYLAVPLPGEGRGAAAVLRRIPPEIWAAFGTMILFGIRWAFSGDTTVIGPNLPALAAVAPLLTAMAYRGAKWLLTIHRFWAVCAVVYLTGLLLARTLQLLLTLVHAFQY